MLQFPVLILFSVAEFSCIGNALVSAEENSDLLTSKIDVQQRLKRWLWGGKLLPRTIFYRLSSLKSVY